MTTMAVLSPRAAATAAESGSSGGEFWSWAKQDELGTNNDEIARQTTQIKANNKLLFFTDKPLC